jgi:sodium-dependent phosphate cotransporter
MSNKTQRTLLQIAILLGLLYLFLVGLDMMGIAFKLFGKDFAETLIERTRNPFVGLFVGILATTLVQSSSTTTSMVVGLVAAGALTIEGAVPIIMGANIGTSVTNTIVSMAHVTRREEFRRAFAGATIHDFFNWMSVIVLLPLEIYFGLLSKISIYLERGLGGIGGTQLLNPLKMVVRPAADWATMVLGENGVLTLVAAVAFMFLALRYLVKVLNLLLSERAENILHNTLFRSAPIAIIAGAIMTVMVQSSSITTSAIIPLVGAGVVTLHQLFPFTIGANIGTTVTAMIAALATGEPAAITVAISHLIFNLLGMLFIYIPKPVRQIPIFLATKMGDLAAVNRPLAAAYILLMFYGVPILLLFLTGTFRG